MKYSFVNTKTDLGLEWLVLWSPLRVYLSTTYCTDTIKMYYYIL